MLAGVKKYYNRIGREVTTMALAGDGGAADVGFQSLSGAAERNEQMLFICVDNEGYMNTGMQASGSTSYGSWTSTTPVGSAMKGKRSEQKNLAVIMMMHNCEYVATASLAFIEDYHDKLDKALRASKRGMAYLHIYSPCPSGWRFPAEQTIEVCRKSVETNFATLWECERGGDLEFTHPVDDPLPVDAYLRLSGKYRHLEKEQLALIQSQVNDRLKQLRRFVA
jgi:phenylglyoxylate dehydrogenase beta subunit